ncbi:KCNH2 [Symbiodinium natans]|uniref:KCNH2 protein n=1 Tax=Symbiodinium natans TaxID=878477 RepID=A0A812GCX2_9DINO|nr:KCNH2 [Symbiodinium natans]
MNMMKVLEPIVAEFPELQELHAIRDASKLPRTCLGRGWVMPTRSDISLSTRLCWRFKAHDTVCSSKPMLQLSDQLSYRYRQYLLSPMGRTRLAWDFLAVLFICTEMITMPLRTFDASLRRVELSVGLLMFWQLDILMRFISSFYKDGKLVQNHRTILFSYARGWLTFDVTFVLIDWLVLLDLFLEKDALYFAQCGLRLVRLARLNSLTEPMMLRLTEQAVIAVAKIAQISMQVLLVRHLMASAWFHIGRLDAEHGWVAKADLSMTSVWYKYTTSLHWMYCQLGFGGTEIEPGTTAERVFGIVVALEGLAIFSTLLVTITTHTTLLTKSAEERRHKFQKLGQFLSSLHVEPELVLRITCFLQHAFAVKERAPCLGKL